MPWWWHTEGEIRTSAIGCWDGRRVYASGLSGPGEACPLTSCVLCGALRGRLKELREAYAPGWTWGSVFGARV